jgi:hypothetical protein
VTSVFALHSLMRVSNSLTVSVNATLYSKPPGATHWSVRTLARAQRVSLATVHRVSKAHRLQPHQIKSFKLSTDPKFFHKLHDILGVYLNPPTQALVLSVDIALFKRSPVAVAFPPAIRL